MQHISNTIIHRGQLHWAIPLEIHIPPVEDLDNIFHRGSVNFKWISQFGNSIWKLYTLCERLNQGWKNCTFSREPNQNFPKRLLNFPAFLYVFLYFRGKNFPPNVKISLKMSRFPGNQVSKFPIFSWPGLNLNLVQGVYMFFKLWNSPLKCLYWEVSLVLK